MRTDGYKQARIPAPNRADYMDISELVREAMNSLRSVFLSARAECVDPGRHTNRPAAYITWRFCSIPSIAAPSLEVDIVFGKDVKFYLSPIARGCEYAAR